VRTIIPCGAADGDYRTLHRNSGRKNDTARRATLMKVQAFRTVAPRAVERAKAVHSPCPRGCLDSL